jgi:hypothetical protein
MNISWNAVRFNFRKNSHMSFSNRVRKPQETTLRSNAQIIGGG